MTRPSENPASIIPFSPVPLTSPSRTRQSLACPHCGHAGPDVITTYEHVGGQGDYVPVIHCENIIECWARWDRQQGLEN